MEDGPLNIDKSDSQSEVSVRQLGRILMMPIALVVWILVADRSILDQDRVHAVARFVSAAFAVHFSSEGHPQ